MPPSGEARHDWQIICDVAKKMGFNSGFNFTHPAEVFAEHVGLSAYQNNGSRDFDLSGLGGLSQQQYDNLKPIQWPVKTPQSQGTKRLFCDGQFFTDSGKAQFIPISAQLPKQQISESYPLVLNTGRLRDQWHTMTRTGLANTLNAHIEEPFIAMHPDDIARFQLRPKYLVNVTSQHTEMPVVLRVKKDENVRPGECFAPIHWSLTNSSAASVTRLFSSDCDPISAQPELKHAAIKTDAVDYQVEIKLFCKAELPAEFLSEMVYWVRSTFAKGTQYRLAYQGELNQLVETIQPLLIGEGTIVQRQSSTELQLSVLLNNELVFAMFAESVDWQSDTETKNMSASNPDSDWVSELFATQIESQSLASLLRIKPGEDYTQGPVVCTCFKVREKQILNAIDGGCESLDELGKQLNCGTNCGSCKPELSAMLEERKAHNYRSLQAIEIKMNDSEDEVLQS
jgi:assimilatory nitrate reductase catalytic subunit